MSRIALLIPCLVTLSGCGLGVRDWSTNPTSAKTTHPSYSTTRDPITVATCPASPAATMEKAGQGLGLCICDELEVVGDLDVSASTRGGKVRVGVNGPTNLTGYPKIDGSLIAYGGLIGVGEVDVKGDLFTATSLEGVGKLTVGGDLGVGGDLTGVGTLKVGGMVRVGGKFEPVVGEQTLGGLAAYTTPELPCGCGAAELLNVSAEVAKAKAQHDNERLGLPAALDLIGKANLTLDTGRFYFAGAKTLGDTRIEIRGAVALFIDGDLETIGEQNIHLAPEATLDLYVAGNVTMVGDSNFGGEPGRFHLYVGGADPVAVAVGQQVLRGSIYAPEAKVTFVGDTTIEGDLFAKKLVGVGTLTIHPAEAAKPSREVCAPALN